MALSKTYKLPAPELLDPADGSGNFQQLATAIEGQAYPSLQSWGSFTGDINGHMYHRFTMYSEQLPTNGIVGWVDVDAYCIATQGYPPSGTAGAMQININNARSGYTRYHNYWKAQNMLVYCSTRWPNPNGVPVTVTVEIYLDSPQTPFQHLMSCGMSYQVYGAKVF